MAEFDPSGGRSGSKTRLQLLSERCQCDGGEPHPVGEVQAGKFAEIGEQVAQAPGFGLDQRFCFRALLRSLGGTVGQGQAKAGDRVHRRRDLMCDVGQELALVAVGSLKPFGHAVKRASQLDQLLRSRGAHAGAELPTRDALSSDDRALNRDAHRPSNERGSQNRSGDHQGEHTCRDQRQVQRRARARRGVVSDLHHASAKRRLDTQLKITGWVSRPRKDRATGPLHHDLIVDKEALQGGEIVAVGADLDLGGDRSRLLPRFPGILGLRVGAFNVPVQQERAPKPTVALMTIAANSHRRSDVSRASTQRSSR